MRIACALVLVGLFAACGGSAKDTAAPAALSATSSDAGQMGVSASTCPPPAAVAACISPNMAGE